MHPDKIQLCVVLVDWTVESTQELRLGEATGAMQLGDEGGNSVVFFGYFLAIQHEDLAQIHEVFVDLIWI